ncbi:MAG: NAD(P)H-hydrate epimerase [Chloroflexi bacterium]|nr:NAD(P)H-hydrate epimerase [Chloroflexota bacterium]
MGPISVEQMIEIDRLVVGAYGITLVQMMENAGRSLAIVARRLAGGSVAGRRVVVLVGKGNNGGGGLVAARHLANAGARVMVALASPPEQLGDVPEQQRQVLARLGVSGSDGALSPSRLASVIESADLVLDALIGYSLRGAPREPIAGFIRLANATRVPRLALDLPSGLDGDRGTPLQPCLQANATLMLAWPKAGLLTAAADAYVGALYLADISVPAAAYRAVGVDPLTLFAPGPIVRIHRLDGDWEPGEPVEELA